MIVNTEFKTLQEAFDFAVTKIVEQGDQCLDYDGACAYTRKDKHCAVGWLLPDNNEMGEFEGDVEDLVKRFKEDVPAIVRKNREAFSVLQQFHDTAGNSKRRCLRRKIEEDYDVDTSGAHWEKWVKMGI
jgi:hypothetical protein